MSEVPPSSEPKPIARVRSYVIRGGRMSEARRAALETLADDFSLPTDGSGWEAWFARFPTRLLEIGFGMGHATVELARTRPDWGLVGLEVHPPGVARVLQQIRELHLENLRVVRADAQTVLPALPARLVDGLLVYFPDPWPKKRHHRRRLVQAPFLQEVERVLRPGGFLNFATDWEPYAVEVRDLLRQRGWRWEGEGWSPRPEWRPQTKFERRALADGRPVFELLARYG